MIDTYKGIQTQTAECLVIGEITNDKLIVVLNKLDLCPPTRGTRDRKAGARIRKTLAATSCRRADHPRRRAAGRHAGAERRGR